MRKRLLSLAILVLLGGLPNAGRSENRVIDLERSVIKVYAFKSGFFSAFAHNHEILAPIASGVMDVSATPWVELVVQTASMQVLDPKVSEEDRTKIQATMLGPEVLDSARFPEIRFRSTGIEAKSDSQWAVRGHLELHGATQPVEFDVAAGDDSYRGVARLKQSLFGIKPISLLGGTVKVKDEVQIEFEIHAEP
jgi:hypothetical protein